MLVEAGLKAKLMLEVPDLAFNLGDYISNLAIMTARDFCIGGGVGDVSACTINGQ